MPSVSLQTIERTLGQNPTHSIIWLHGLGASGYDFYPIVPELALPADLAVRFVFPHAPEQPVTVNGGYIMPAWYDILSLDGIERQIDTNGIEQSVAAIQQLIEQEVQRGIAEENIILAGFSQGGVIALVTGLTHARRLGGIMALSTYLPLRSHWQFSAANQDIPVFVAHGRHDDVVPLVLGEQIVSLLQAEGRQPQWHTYPAPHSVTPQEIRDISTWLQQLLQR